MRIESQVLPWTSETSLRPQRALHQEICVGRQEVGAIENC